MDFLLEWGEKTFTEFHNYQMDIEMILTSAAVKYTKIQDNMQKWKAVKK